MLIVRKGARTGNGKWNENVKKSTPKRTCTRTTFNMPLCTTCRTFHSLSLSDRKLSLSKCEISFLSRRSATRCRSPFLSIFIRWCAHGSPWSFCSGVLTRAKVQRRIFADVKTSTSRVNERIYFAAVLSPRLFCARKVERIAVWHAERADVYYKQHVFLHPLACSLRTKAHSAKPSLSCSTLSSYAQRRLL